MPSSAVFVFKCGNEKCNATVPTDSLNKVKLKVVRSGPVQCKKCGQRTRWSETAQLVVPEKKDDESEILEEVE